jgi:hypothetical protein
MPKRGEGSEVSPAEVRQRPGEQEPSADAAILEGIVFFIPERCADASAARIVGEEDIPCVVDHWRGGMRFGMRGIGMATVEGLTVPTGLDEGKRPDDQECCDFHVRIHPSLYRHPLAIGSNRPDYIGAVKVVDVGSVEGPPGLAGAGGIPFAIPGSRPLNPGARGGP